MVSLALSTPPTKQNLWLTPFVECVMNEDVHIRGALELKGDHVRMQRNVDDDDDDSDDDDGVVLEYNNVSMVWGAEKQHQHTNTLNMYIIIEE